MRPDTRNPEAYFRFRFGEGIPAKGSDMFGPGGHLGTILCMPPSLQAHPERERERVCVCVCERERVCVCVKERERKREREKERERERERERDLVPDLGESEHSIIPQRDPREGKRESV